MKYLLDTHTLLWLLFEPEHLSKNTISYLNLPLFQNHRDPFDRMLISTAIERNFILLSRDMKLPQYDSAGLLHLW